MRRIVLVDDHALFRAGVRGELGDAVEIVGEAGSVAEAVPLIRDADPEVVLLDVHLPDVSGLYLAHALSGDAAVVLTSSRDASDFADRLSGSGACGFVPKAELSGDALDALLP